MARQLTCRLDRELDKAIKHYAARNRLTLSQAVRELLRQTLTDADDVTRGWREGFSKAYSEMQRERQEHIGKVGKQQ
jgi:metal-responsive CopG/Arc/MetJ family transcriptional regulator